jgi:hypothetical protein
MLRHQAGRPLAQACSPNAPLQDWYGTDARIAAMDHLLADATLDIPFEESEWPGFLETSIARGHLETADLVKNYRQLKGKNYLEIFQNLLRVIADTRSCGGRKWVGFHETWILDFYPMLARAFPEAKFLIMFRDPRATISSMLGVRNIDPLQVAQVLSYVRHWRKYVALAHRYLRAPFFKDRLHVTAHELVLTQTESTLAAICKAFDLELDRRMLDTGNFHNYATGETWSGNSSFEKKTEGISAHRALRWRSQMDPMTLGAIEYLCGPDLRLIGYPIFTDFANPDTNATSDITDFLVRDHAGYSNWRSDLNDSLADLGLEAVRRQLLRLPKLSVDTALIRRTFLFEETYHALSVGDGPLLPALQQAL